MDVRLQLLHAEVAALEAERAWLTQRGPLHDALLLLVAFERLRRERTRFRDTAIKTSEAQLRSLTERMFTLDDQLYEFDRSA